MGDNHDKLTPPAAKNTLLDELESIRGLLDDCIEDDELNLEADIPILSDVVTAADKSSKDGTGLLDLEHIFEDLADKGTTTADSSQPDIALDDLECTEFGLEELNLDDTDIDFPDFTLQAEISDLQLSIPQSPARDTDSSDLDADPQALDEDALWLADDPVADQQSPLPAGVEEDQQALLPADPAAPDSSPSPLDSVSDNIDMALLIQEIVDEFIPQIEDQLRRRLSQCSPDTIQQLAKKHLTD